MLGAKIYIDFTKYEFVECCSKLKNELDSVLRNQKEHKTEKTEKKIDSTHAKTVIVELNNENTESKVIESQLIGKNLQSKGIDIKKIIPEIEISQPNENNPPYLWSESELNFWLIDKNIATAIILNVSPCDGKLLEQLY